MLRFLVFVFFFKRDYVDKKVAVHKLQFFCPSFVGCILMFTDIKTKIILFYSLGLIF